MTDKLLLMLPVGSFKCYQNTHGGWGLSGEEAEEGHAQVVHELISRCGVDVQDNVKTSFTLPATNSTSSALKGPLRLPALMAKKQTVWVETALSHCMAASGRKITTANREEGTLTW